MRSAGLITVASFALIGPGPAPTHAAEWHVSPSGSPQADGSAQHPWDLQTALAGAPDAAGSPRVVAGDTVWLHGGTYRGGFESTLAGTADKPITVAQAPGERATIDARPRDARDNALLHIRGQHAVFRDFELTCSDPKRVTTIPGSWPEDIRRGGLSCRGSHIKLVNLVVHDAMGVNAWSEGEGGEVYGCLIYNNGWKGPDRAHGHAIYAQNRRGTKRLEDNIVFHQFGYGIHCYGSEKAFLEGFHLEGNIGFNNGCLANPDDLSPALLIGGGTPVRRLTVIDNNTYNGGLRCGYPWGVMNDAAKITGNYVIGGLYIRDFARLTVRDNTFAAPDTIVWLEGSTGLDTSAYAWDHNVYYRTSKGFSDLVIRKGRDKEAVQRGVSFDEWRKATGIDRETTFKSGYPTGTRAVVRPNRYEKGRANVAVYNWDEAESVEVDLSKVLARGQRYKIVNVTNFFGEEALTGAYDGAAVRLPMRPTAPAQPVGMADYKLPVTQPRFGVFVVLPVK
jgi:hypothetical protein